MDEIECADTFEKLVDLASFDLILPFKKYIQDLNIVLLSKGTSIDDIKERRIREEAELREIKRITLKRNILASAEENIKRLFNSEIDEVAVLGIDDEVADNNLDDMTEGIPEQDVYLALGIQELDNIVEESAEYDLESILDFDEDNLDDSVDIDLEMSILIDEEKELESKEEIEDTDDFGDMFSDESEDSDEFGDMFSEDSDELDESTEDDFDFNSMITDDEDSLNDMFEEESDNIDDMFGNDEESIDIDDMFGTDEEDLEELDDMFETSEEEINQLLDKASSGMLIEDDDDDGLEDMFGTEDESDNSESTFDDMFGTDDEEDDSFGDMFETDGEEADNSFGDMFESEGEDDSFGEMFEQDTKKIVQSNNINTTNNNAKQIFNDESTNKVFSILSGIVNKIT